MAFLFKERMRGLIAAKTFLKDQRLYLPMHRNASPQISVILPLPKGSWSHHFAATIQSILVQSMKDFELIIVGDGCDQTVINAIVNIQANEPRIIYAHHDTWSELPALRINEGLLLAKGKYIAYMFSGIVWNRNALLWLHQRIKPYGSPTIVYGKSILSNKKNFGEEYNYGTLMKLNIIPNHAVLHHVQIVHDIGGFEFHAAARHFSDWDFWMRCTKSCQMVYMDIVISYELPNLKPAHAMTDINVSRSICSLDRADRLQLTQLHRYNVDDMDLFYRQLDRKMVDIIYGHYVFPWLQNHGSGALLNETASPRTSTTLLVAVTQKNASVEICLSNFQKASQNRILPIVYYEEQANTFSIEAADVLVLFRALSMTSMQLQNTALAINKPVVYMLDDDLLGIHEHKEWADWGPGSWIYSQISTLIQNSDIVAVYSPIVKEVVRAINPRVIQMNTNILSECIDKQRFPDQVKAAPFRIGIINTGSRSEELRFLWPALCRLSEEKGNAIQIDIWGDLPNGLPSLRSPVTKQPVTLSYYEYLKRLSHTHMDLMLVPLFDNIRSRRSKSPIKYLEATAAGTIGLYSNNSTYNAVKQGVTGFKINNTVEDWFGAMKKMIALPFQERKRIWSYAQMHILSEFSTESQLENFDTMIELSRLHRSTRGKRYSDGMPRIAYLIQPDDRQFYDHAIMAERYGIKPVWVMPESSRGSRVEMVDWIMQRREELDYIPDIAFSNDNAITHSPALVEKLAKWLQNHNISIIHSPSKSYTISEAAKVAGIPYVVYKVKGVVYASKLFSVYNEAFLNVGIGNS